MLYKVVRYMNNPILERPVAPVREFDTPQLHTLIADMFETMHVAHGVGLAAPQIDIDQRITVIDVSGAVRDDDDDKKDNKEKKDIEPDPIVLINPEIVH